MKGLPNQVIPKDIQKEMQQRKEAEERLQM